MRCKCFDKIDKEAKKKIRQEGPHSCPYPVTCCLGDLHHHPQPTACLKNQRIVKGERVVILQVKRVRTMAGSKNHKAMTDLKNKSGTLTEQEAHDLVKLEALEKIIEKDRRKAFQVYRLDNLTISDYAKCYKSFAASRAEIDSQNLAQNRLNVQTYLTFASKVLKVNNDQTALKSRTLDFVLQVSNTAAALGLSFAFFGIA